MQLNRPTQVLADLIGAFAPACYAPTWVPWLRWVGAVCIVVVLVVVLHLTTGHTATLLVP